MLQLPEGVLAVEQVHQEQCGQGAKAEERDSHGPLIAFWMHKHQRIHERRQPARQDKDEHCRQNGELQSPPFEPVEFFALDRGHPDTTRNDEAGVRHPCRPVTAFRLRCASAGGNRPRVLCDERGRYPRCGLAMFCRGYFVSPLPEYSVRSTNCATTPLAPTAQPLPLINVTAFNSGASIFTQCIPSRLVSAPVGPTATNPAS